MKRFAFFCLLLLVFSSFTERKKTWVAIGDSITYLNDHLHETGDRVDKGYLTRVTEALPAIQYINQGHNGWTAVNIADKIKELGLVKADVYTIFLGTNDWWQGLSLGTLANYQDNTGNATVFGAFRTIVDYIKQLNKEAAVVFITPMQRADFVYIDDNHNNAWGSYKQKNGQDLEQFAEAVKAIAQLEGYPVIDLYHDPKLTVPQLVKFKRLKNQQTGEYTNYSYPAYTDVSFDPDKDEYPYPPEAMDMTYDGLHPSDSGNQVIADRLISVLSH